MSAPRRQANGGCRAEGRRGPFSPAPSPPAFVPRSVAHAGLSAPRPAHRRTLRARLAALRPRQGGRACRSVARLAGGHEKVPAPSRGTGARVGLRQRRWVAPRGVPAPRVRWRSLRGRHLRRTAAIVVHGITSFVGRAIVMSGPNPPGRRSAPHRPEAAAPSRGSMRQSEDYRSHRRTSRVPCQIVTAGRPPAAAADAFAAAGRSPDRHHACRIVAGRRPMARRMAP